MISTRITKIILFTLLLFAINLGAVSHMLKPAVVYAQDVTTSESGSLEEELRKQREENNRKNDCVAGQGSPNLTKDNCGIINYILIFVRVLSGLVGIVIVIMLAVRGIQYIVARENPQLTAKAREGILWAVLALILYLFVFAFLQWLVPGGVL